MKVNWHLPRAQKSGRREHGNSECISDTQHWVGRDTELPDIVDASRQASSLYGGIPTATRLIPQIPVKSDAIQPTRPKKVADPGTNWSTPVQNLLDQPPAAFPVQIMLGGVAFLAIFGAWAWFGTINEIGYARGELMHQGNVHKIHSVESGKIAHLAIAEGDTIKAGQVMAELDTELDQTEIDRLQEQIAAFEIQVVQTQSQIDQKRTQSQTIAAISQADLQAHNVTIAQADNNARTIESVITGLDKDIAEAQNRRERLAVTDEMAPELLKQLQAEIDANQTRLERLQPLVERGAISRDFLFQAEQNLRNSQNALLKTQMSDRDEQTMESERLFEVEQSQRDREARLTESQGQLEQAKADKERLIAQFAQKQAEAQKNQLDIQQQIQQLEIALTQLHGNIAESQNLLARAQTQLEQRFLYAPVDGVVLSLHIDHSGEVIQAGQTIAEVAPSSAQLVLSAKLANKDAGFVKVGLPVQLKFDSYPFQEYGLISGKVSSMSPTTQPDPQLGKIYTVEISLERNYVTEEGQKIYFKPGQTASAEIVIRHRRIIDLMLDPIRELKEGGINF